MSLSEQTSEHDERPETLPIVQAAAVDHGLGSRHPFITLRNRPERARRYAHLLNERSVEFALPHMPTDEETARMVIFLASEMAACTTGRAVLANGGVTFQ